MVDMKIKGYYLFTTGVKRRTTHYRRFVSPCYLKLLKIIVPQLTWGSLTELLLLEKDKELKNGESETMPVVYLRVYGE